MKALIIGGTGPTGPYIVEGLLQRGYQVTILHRGTHEVDMPPEVEHIHGDPHFVETLEEALAGLERFPDSRILAGGTDLLVLMKDLLAQTRSLISLARIKDLAESHLNEKGLRLRPMMPLWRLEKWEAAKRTYPALLQAVRSLAAPPIRNQATIGGNLCLDTKCIYYNQYQMLLIFYMLALLDLKYIPVL